MLRRFGNIDFSNGQSAFANTLRLVDGAIDLSWHHCGTTSEFLGEMFALRVTSSKLDYNEARHSIGYLVNELLENAVKFRSPGDIIVESSFDGGLFEIRITNFIGADTSARFMSMLAEVTSRDPGDLLIERIEANAADASSSGSGLGLLTLMSDYGVRLGWTFDPGAEGDSVRLQTYAALKLS
jgi:hypothetical protein